MNIIENQITAAINDEMANAVSVFGLHNSAHEKYAVCNEEYDEAYDEIQKCVRCMNTIWELTKNNENTTSMYQSLADAAKNLAIEACQLAAVANKSIK